MRRERIDMHRLQELVRLHREGIGAREVARQLMMSPNTERKYREVFAPLGLLSGGEELPSLGELRALVEHAAPIKSPQQEVSSIESFSDRIKVMLDNEAGPTSIYDRLRLESDFKGSLSAVKRMCKRLKKEQGVRARDVVIRVETAPGDVAQVDFGYIGKLFDPDTGRIRKAYVFAMVLGHSRLLWVDLVFDQTLSTWVDQHRRAFEYFGGVPQTLVPDNLKAAVLKCFFGFKEKPELNRSYRELARHYKFRVDPTPPYTPQHKGKVESAVQYVKSNFFKPRTLETMGEARAELALWREKIANARVHGTTRKVPRVHYDEVEREAMLPMPPHPYTQITWKTAKVHPDSHVQFERRLYSVPFKYIGRQVSLKVCGDTVTILVDDEVVAQHVRRGPRYHTQDAHLPEGRRDLRHRSRDWWQAKATGMSPIVGEYIEAVFGADDVYSQLRTVQAMVGHLEKYPKYRADAACQRAHEFGNYTFQGLRAILYRGLDLQPARLTPEYVHGRLEEPRFARSMADLLGTTEVRDGE